MRKKRADGYYIENINPYLKLVPHIMPHRYDAMNWCKVEVRCDGLDKFISEQAQLGKTYTYPEIITASLVRLFARRPCLNRFVKNKRIYQHNDIAVSFVVKKQLRDDSEDTTVKIHCNGSETLDEVKAKMDEVIEANVGTQAYNSVDKTAQILTNAPHFMISLAVGALDFLDNHNLLPKKIIEISPFHNSMFITFMKSIKGDYLYHHCYEFGTTGVFVSLGKEKLVPVVECGEIKPARVLTLGLVLDERMCDGLYYVNSMRVWKNILLNPAQLFEPYDAESELQRINCVRTEEDKAHYKELAKQHEIDKKERKKAEKLAKKQAKADEKARKKAEKQAKRESKKK